MNRAAGLAGGEGRDGAMFAHIILDVLSATQDGLCLDNKLFVDVQLRREENERAI